MSPPHQRRKERRPEEIIEAAFEEFSEKGYSRTRLQDVATRAGVSKGLPYLYFRTKEELFKRVLKHLVKPRVERILEGLEASDGRFCDFLTGPFVEHATAFAHSKMPRVLRLLVAEGPRHPDLLDYYTHEILEPTLDALRTRLRRAQQQGEINTHRLDEFPQLIVAPVLLGALWHMLFEPSMHLDTRAMLQVHTANLVARLTQEKTS